MHDFTLILTAAGALLLGAISPGPSFVVVVRTSVAASRRNGLAVALGLCAGSVVFGSCVLVGLTSLLSQVGWLYLIVRAAGACYLACLAVRLWRQAADPIVFPRGLAPPVCGTKHSFTRGVVTQLSNPKTAIVYGGILAALLPATPSIWLSLSLLATIALVEAGWYSIVALSFSSRRPRQLYSTVKPTADRIAGTVIGLLGIRLAVDATR